MKSHDELLEEGTRKLSKQCIKEVKRDYPGLVGYELGEKVFAWFLKNTDHPHPRWTFEYEAMNRNMAKDDTDRFAKDLACEMADLVIENEIISIVKDRGI